MRKHSEANPRIKRLYVRYLREAKRRDEKSIDSVARALSRFEEGTGHKDFLNSGKSRQWHSSGGWSSGSARRRHIQSSPR